jgi:hypothetical protein
MKAPERSAQALVSIIVSAATAGFVSASISFDFDVSPTRRKETPEFYGYVPDGLARTLIFGGMCLNSMLLLLIRSFCAALLMLANTSYLLWYLLGDMSIYLLLKTARGDFLYWTPVYGYLGFFVSFLARVISKVIVDFTGVTFFRHPGEVGGLYFSLSMLMALASSFVAIEVYFWSTEVGTRAMENGTRVMEKGDAIHLVLLMIGAWLVTFGLNLLLMKKKYRKTFFSLKLGKTAIMEKFESENEEVKAAIFTKNRNLWVEIEEDVKEWVMNNWWRWKEEQPAWLTEGIIAKIPDEFIPSEESRVALNRMRRRSSFVASMSELTASRPSLKFSKQSLLTISHTIVPVIEQHEEEESGGEDKSDKSEVTRKAEATE